MNSHCGVQCANIHATSQVIHYEVHEKPCSLTASLADQTDVIISIVEILGNTSGEHIIALFNDRIF